MKRRITTIAIGVIMGLTLFSLPATRALASEFLGLFRVQKFAPISVSPQQLEKLSELGETGLFPGEVTSTSEFVDPIEFDSFSEAEIYMTQLDRPTWSRTFYGLGEPDSVVIEGSVSGEMMVNLAGARSILEAVDVDPMLLPDSLDGATIAMQVNEMLVQQWYEDEILLVQTASPGFAYPADVDIAVVGEAILQFLGMEDGEAYRLSRNINWTTTMVLPIPADLGTFSEVSVGNTTGLAIESIGDGGTTIVWQENGLMYVLTDTGESASADSLLALIEAGDFR